MPIIAAVQGYDLNIGVGQAQAIDVAGDRVHFINATDPFAVIELRPNFSQGNIVLKPGQGYRFGEQVQRWVVYNRGNLPLTGSLMIGTGDFFDQRISGTVDVIDGGKARTLGGTAMMGYGYDTGVAGQLMHVQLWNPAGSAKNFYVEQIQMLVVTGGVAQGVGIRSYATALSTLGSNAQSKNLGGAASVGEIRTQKNAAAFGTATMGVLDKTTKVLRVAEPILVRPGNGLTLFNAVAGEDLGAAFEFYEEVS
ncbi:hypothetical protein [Cupriavidus campinensis]|uniref:hypothetical protein n=1 Tax=Cupriavidus campinensis TaxID=151783 RepID=UPI0024E1CABC|nr:hypothetical protein [Cupriavidus campinensis]